MKTNNFNISFLFMIILVISFVGCKKEQQRLRNGVYVGNFGYYDNDTLYGSLKPVVLKIKNGKYKLTDTWNNSHFYEGREGNVKIKYSTIIFDGGDVYTEPWFISNYIDGTYNYTFDGTRLTMWTEGTKFYLSKY